MSPPFRLAEWEAAELVARYQGGASVQFLADWYGLSDNGVRKYLDRHPGRRGLCAAEPCPVVTPREFCYFHAVAA